MKKLLTLPIITALFAAALCSGTVHADETKPEAPKKTSPKAGEDLHSLMKKIGKDFGPLAKSVDDKSKVSANLKTVKQLIELSDKCAALVPSSAEKVPAAEREKFVAGYKVEIDKLTETFRKMAAALEKKDFAAAKAAIGEAGALKQADHPKYIKKK